MNFPEYPIWPYFSRDKVREIWRVPYDQRAKEAKEWARSYKIKPAAEDKFKIHLFLVDVQNTFCIPDFELFVRGSSGFGAIEDNQRLCEFIYRNIGSITGITASMDTHQFIQIFHEVFWIDKNGNHPAPYTLITAEDVNAKKWRFNSQIASTLNKDPLEMQDFVSFYVQQLSQSGKYSLTIWPYHAILGGIGHALVSSVEEAVFFHANTRLSQPIYEMKGSNSYSENYSVIKPEVMRDNLGNKIGQKNKRLIESLMCNDALIIAGQAKSHCVAFSIRDLLDELRMIDPKLASKVFLLEDCSSPVVIPGVIDYTQVANDFYSGFEQAGMHLVKSTKALNEWF
jgi:nicotinamidase-related amidase